MALCGEIKANGEACKSPGNYPDGRCWAHSNTTAEQRRAGAAKGGRRSGIAADLTKYKARLVEISEGVLNGKFAPNKGSIAIQGYGVAVRACEAALKARQLEESELVRTQLLVEEQQHIINRMEELHELLEAKQRQGIV
jgi:hypothetical protein